MIVRANDKEYEFKANSRALRDIDNQIGKNPVIPFFDLPIMRYSDMVELLYGTMQGDRVIDRVYQFIDDYTADGHDQADIITNILIPVFQEAGILQKTEGTDPN